MTVFNKPQRLLAMRFCACVFASVIIFAPQLNAQELETVIVKGKAQGPKSLSDVNLEQYTGFAKVLERDAFADRMSSVPELLKSLPSVQVKQSAGLGSNSEISLRGSKGKQVNVFVDGLLMNSPFQGTANIQTLPTVLIERIEAYPDFTPLALSNANLAGAVNFHTRDLKPEEKGGQLSLAYGSFNTQQAELSGWSDVSGWQLMGGLNYQASDNDYPVPPNDLPRENEKTRQNDNYWAKSGFVKLGKKFDSSTLQLFAQKNTNHKALATVNNSPRDEAFLENDTERLQAVLDYGGGLWQVSHRAFYANEQSLFNDELGTIGLGKDKDLTEQDVFGLLSVASVFVGSHEFLSSLSLQHNTFYQKDLLKNKADLDGNREIAVFSVADNWYASEKLMLNATARKFWLQESMQYLADTKPDADNSESYNSWHLGFSYALFPPFTLKGNAGRSIRVPYLFEKFGSVGAFRGNPNLKTEQADLFDLGFVVDGERYQLSAGVFHKDIENGIYIIFDSRGIGHPMNIGFSTVAGVEGNLLIKPINWLEISGNFTFLESENNSYIKSRVGWKMPGIYHQNYGASLTLIAGFVRFSNSLQIYDQMYYDPANTVPADRQELVNSSLTMNFESIVFDITARNLLDKNYMDFNYMPTPGRSITGTLTINF